MNKKEELFKIIELNIKNLVDFDPSLSNLVDYFEVQLNQAFVFREELETEPYLIRGFIKEYKMCAEILIAMIFLRVILYKVVDRWCLEDIRGIYLRLHKIGNDRGWDFKLLQKSLSKCLGGLNNRSNIKSIVDGADYN